MKAQHIQILVAIADAGSLRAAAQVLGKSQPALTKALRQAEDDLGVPIFQRSSRGVVLTELGERVLARARTINSEIARLDDEVAQLRGEQVGSIHVGVSPFAAVKIMPQALARFHEDHPSIEVHLSSGLFPNALKPLRDGKIDLLVGPSPPIGMARDITIEPLLDTPIVVVTSRKSPFRNATSLEQLADAPWIMLGAPLGPGDIFRRLFVDRGIPPPKAKTTSETYFGAMALIENLGAVCTFPLRLLEDVQKGWDVEQIPLTQTLEPFQISLMSRSGHPLTPLAEKLANNVRRQGAYLCKTYNQ
ncbi:MAG: LysR substrate-binding domain-containing protein [Pseudomonadota bacterium]